MNATAVDAPPGARAGPGAAVHGCQARGRHGQEPRTGLHFYFDLTVSVLMDTRWMDG